jgi:hypothetical protein
VELTDKAPRRLRAICRAWGRAHHVTRVRYCAAPHVIGLLERTIRATDTGEKIEVATASLKRGRQACAKPPADSRGG